MCLHLYVLGLYGWEFILLKFNRRRGGWEKWKTDYPLKVSQLFCAETRTNDPQFQTKISENLFLFPFRPIMRFLCQVMTIKPIVFINISNKQKNSVWQSFLKMVFWGAGILPRKCQGLSKILASAIVAVIFWLFYFKIYIGQEH